MCIFLYIFVSDYGPYTVAMCMIEASLCVVSNLHALDLACKALWPCLLISTEDIA